MIELNIDVNGHNSLFFSSFSPEGRELLTALGVEKSWAKGETIFHRGDKGSYIVIIQDGIAEVSITSLNGRKSVLNHMRVGEILGEVAMLDGGTRSADVVAHTPMTGVILQQVQLQQFLQDHPKIAYDLIAQLCEKVRNASDMFETHAMTSAAARLARCLINFSRKWGEADTDDGIVISQKFSQSDLGEFSGLARENVNRYIKNWSRDGLISFDKGHITLHDLDKLKTIAEI